MAEGQRGVSCSTAPPGALPWSRNRRLKSVVVFRLKRARGCKDLRTRMCPATHAMIDFSRFWLLVEVDDALEVPFQAVPFKMDLKKLHPFPFLSISR